MIYVSDLWISIRLALGPSCILYDFASLFTVFIVVMLTHPIKLYRMIVFIYFIYQRYRIAVINFIHYSNILLLLIATTTAADTGNNRNATATATSTATTGATTGIDLYLVIV